MDIDFKHIVRLSSILGILFPIFVCVLTFKKGSRDFRLFFLFLLVGLFADLTMFIIEQIGGNGHRGRINLTYNVYSLVEAVFFIYLIKTFIQNLLFKKVSSILFYLTPFLWFVLQMIRIMNPSRGFLPGKFFDLYYEITFSFLAGFVLLEMVEKYDSVSDKPMFWIFLGIFFYCFSIFFIATFLNTELSQKLWFLHNIFNIITYVFYTVGLYKYFKIQKTIQ